MNDYKLPELPSDDELGITDADREAYEKDVPNDGPEMTEAERTALLGESGTVRPTRRVVSGAPGAGDTAKPSRAERRAAKKAAREQARAAKEARSAAKKAARESLAAEKDSKEAAKKAAGAAPALEPPADDAPAPARGDGEAGRRTRWRGPLTLAALLLTAVFASSRTGIPRPAPANAPESQFSSARAMATLIEVARQAHPPGSPEHTRVRSLLVDRLSALGLEPRIQTTTSVVQRSGRARAATVRNVVARLPGSDPTGAVLVTAHYDSRELAIGAGDDGSGVVTILEALRALQTGDPVRNDLIVLLTDAEELGLLGARAFVDQDSLMTDVTLALSFEMRGAGGPSIMFETNENNGWVVGSMREWATHPFANSMSYEIYRRLPNDTDFTPFREAGVQGLNFAAIDRAHVYHQQYDRPDNLSEATLQHHGLQALEALRYFGNADLSDVDDDNLVYFTVPGIGLIVYPHQWVLPLSGALLLFFVVVAIVARSKGATALGVAGGLVVSLICMGLAYALGYAMMQWLPGRHPEFGALQGSAFYSEGWYLLALASGALGLVTGLAALAGRWLSLVEITLGALVVPVLGAAALSWFAPLAAMNLQWPVLAALVSVLAVAVLGVRADGAVGWITALLLATPVVLMLEPLVELVWLAMSIRLAGVLAVLSTVALLLCLPALAALRHPNSWWAPVAAFALAGAALGIGNLANRPSGDRPAPTTLVYAYEHGTGSALWATSPVAESDAGTPAAVWARSRIGGAFTESRDLSDFGWRSGAVPVAPAPVVSALPPSVVVAGDTVVDGERFAVVRVRSQIGAEALQFHLDEGVEIRSINGNALSNPGEIRTVEHWGIPESDVVLEVAMPAGRAIGVHIVEHLLRPQELLGAAPFTRDDALAPNVNSMSDRAMLRFSIAALADPQHATVPIAQPDSVSAQPDSVSAQPDSVSAQPDTTVGPQDRLPVRDTADAARRRRDG